MRKRILARLFVFAAGCLFFTSCFFQTSSTTVKGRVHDDENRPVADAEVRFGGTGSETVTKTQPNGSFTATARHRPTQMLNLTVSKPGVGAYADKFPGFAAPKGDINVKLMGEIQTIRITK